MPLHEGGDIKLGLLEDLDFADVAVLDGEDAGGLALDLLPDGGGDELLDEALEVSLGADDRGDDAFIIPCDVAKLSARPRLGPVHIAS